MSIERTYWQGMGTPREPWTRCSPNLTVVEAHVIARAGGQNLGCLNVRPIRGGTSWSSHAFGAARDWRYANVGAGHVEVGREAVDDVILPWYLDNADALGVQQIHDYRAGRIWRSGLGWRNSTGDAMGERWALWLHIETNIAQWANRTAVELRGVPTLDLDLDTEPNPPAPTPGDLMQLRPVTFDHVTLSPSTPGPDKYVAAWQALINQLSGSTLVVDGHYGAMTARQVENLQRWYKLTIDGILGPQTARALLDR